MNNLNNIGDELIVNVNIQATGFVTLTNFTDTFNGITAQRYVERDYRVTINEVLWDDWKELNISNLSSKTYKLFDNILHIQVRYRRVGSDPSGVISFLNIDFSGSWQNNTFQAPTLSNSIFSSLIGTDELINTERNLFKKLYLRGIIPNYILRGENRNYYEDEDYISLMSAIAKFFAIIICNGKRFSRIYDEEDMILEYIKQWGIYVNDGDINIEDLKNISSEYLEQIHNRGTELIFKRKGFTLPNGKMISVDGEFLRLFRNNECDELLYENIERKRIGLCIGNSSPLYRGTGYSKQLNKVFHEIGDSWANYGLSISTGPGNYFNFQDNYLEASFGNLGGDFYVFDNKDSSIVCDYNIDYEISFEFLKNGVSELSAVIYGYDKNKQPLEDAFCDTNETAINNVLIGNKLLSTYEDDIWYRIRFIIRSYQSIAVSEVNDDIEIINLKFNNNTIKYFRPNLIFSSTGNSDLFIKNFSIKPLVRGKNILPSKNDGRVNAFSLGFIQSSSLFHTYVRNNNNNKSEKDIIDIVERYLYPFNNINVFTVISKY